MSWWEVCLIERSLPLKAGTATRQRSSNSEKKAGMAARRVTLTATLKKLLFLRFALTSQTQAALLPLAERIELTRYLTALKRKMNCVCCSLSGCG